MADDPGLIERLYVSCATLSEVEDLIAGLDPRRREKLRDVSNQIMSAQKFMTGLAANLRDGLDVADAMLKAR